MNKDESQRRLERIATIATEIAGVPITASVAKAVDDARRAEYYERKERAA